MEDNLLPLRNYRIGHSMSQAKQSVEDHSQEHTSTNDNGDVLDVESVVEDDNARITEKSDQAESLTGERELEDHKKLFYMKLLEYEENLPKQYDKEKFVKSWAKTNFKKTTIGEKDSQISLKTECPVVTRDEIFNVIHKCHLRTGHSCRDTTWHEVKNSYVGISCPYIDLYIEGCTTCSTRKPLKKPIAGKSTMLFTFLTRVQVDLIDMPSSTDNEFRYIMHARDHFSKFSWAYPLVTKNAAAVAEKLMTIFTQFGPPLILQSNNGRTFVATVISQLKHMHIWTDHLIINGSPMDPQYQGCIEKANGDLEINLGIWIQDNQKGWSSGLPIVVYGMNTSVSSTTNKTPYEIVFRQHPRSSIAMFEQLAAQEIVNEEDLPIEILDTLDESSNFGVTEAVTEVSQAKHSVEDHSQEHTITNDNGDVPDVESVAEDDDAEITEKSDQAESLTGMDTTGCNPITGVVDLLKTNTSQRKVEVQQPRQDRKDYRVNSGKVLVLNNTEFHVAGIDLGDRTGSDSDASAIFQRFYDMEFEIDLKADITKEATFTWFENAKAQMIINPVDCFVLILLSHGTEDGIYARDSLMPITDIIEIFNATNCPQLRYKPKVLICQRGGSNLSYGVDVRIDPNQSGSTPDYSEYRDFLFAYAADPGTGAFINAESGSSFIIHLSNAMEKMEIDEDFYSVLTTVNKTVGLTYQPRNNSLQLDNVQMPCVVSHLTKVLRLKQRS